RSGTLPLLIVQATEAGPLTAEADVVLPGSAWLEKDAIYTNDQGRVQASARTFAAPGEALDDWQILREVAGALGLSLPYRTGDGVRRAIASALTGAAYDDVDQLVFARPVNGRNWLQASNPSERWKWDFMFQDLPPVKGHSVQTEQGVVDGRVIPLKPID